MLSNRLIRIKSDLLVALPDSSSDLSVDWENMRDKGMPFSTLRSQQSFNCGNPAGTGNILFLQWPQVPAGSELGLPSS